MARLQIPKPRLTVIYGVQTNMARHHHLITNGVKQNSYAHRRCVFIGSTCLAPVSIGPFDYRSSLTKKPGCACTSFAGPRARRISMLEVGQKNYHSRSRRRCVTYKLIYIKEIRTRQHVGRSYADATPRVWAKLNPALRVYASWWANAGSAHIPLTLEISPPAAGADLSQPSLDKLAKSYTIPPGGGRIKCYQARPSQQAGCWATRLSQIPLVCSLQGNGCKAIA